MYEGGPDKTEVLNLIDLLTFINTIDFALINSVGLYGGEPTLHLDAYNRIAAMLPTTTPIWMISNGAWSKDPDRLVDLIRWCRAIGLRRLIVSGNPEQVKHQDARALHVLSEECPEAVTLKEPDGSMLMMGRLAHRWDGVCSGKCSWKKSDPTRIAVTPPGDIMFQTCDGSYPVIGNISQPFSQIAEICRDFNHKTCSGLPRAFGETK